MIPFDPLTLSSLMVLAASNAQICNMPKPTAINVMPKTSEVVIDTSQSLQALQQTEVDTINPYGFHGKSYTKGYATSPAQLKYNVKLGQKYLPQYDAFCLWYDEINIEILLEPQITIAAEVAKDKCQYKAVLEHEMKHVKTTRIVVNKYTQSMGQKVYDGLKQRGFLVGPVPQLQGQQTFDRMQKTVNQIVDFEWRKMQIEHEEEQQAVDSLEEYERVSSLCPKSSLSNALKGP